MQPRSAFLTACYGSIITWDVTCQEEQTASHAVAALIANKWTRWPVIALIFGTVFHLFMLAATMLDGDR